MTGFLEQFFPETIGKESTQAGDLYCTYNNQKIQWFTSSLFLAGAATELSGTTGQPPPQLAAPLLLQIVLQAAGYADWPLRQICHGDTPPHLFMCCSCV